jgi:hypothetical protein
MKQQIFKIFLAILLNISIINAFSQQNCISQIGKDFSLGQTEANACITYTARDQIIFTPGFSYSALNPPIYIKS